MATTVAQIRAEISATGAAQTRRDIESVGAAVDGTRNRAQVMGAGMTAVGASLGAGFLVGLNGAMQLEQGIANINASLGGVSTAELDAISSQIQEIGVNSQYSAVEVAAVTDSIIKSGFTQEQVMGGMTQSVVDLSQATGDGLDSALTAVTATMATYREGIVDSDLAMTDGARVADIFTVAANESAAGLDDINAGMRSLGPVAAMLGIPVEDAAAGIALFTTNGLKGADAGISLARGLQNLAAPSSAVEGNLADLGLSMDSLGISAFDANGQFIGMPALFEQLQTGMAGLDDQTKFAALSTIFGAEAMDVMGLAILNGADPLEALIGLMGESGVAAEQSALRMDTLGAQFDTLKEGVSTLLASFVSGLLPGFRFLVDGANMVIDALMQIPGPIKTIIGAVMGIGAVLLTAAGAWVLFGSQIGAVIGILGGIAFGPIIAGIAALAAGAGLVYAAWRSDFGGLRSMVKRFFRPVTRAIDAFKETWADLTFDSEVMDRMNEWGGRWSRAAGQIASGTNVVSKTLLALSSAIRTFGDGDIPFFNNLADGLQRAAGFVDRFKAAWDSLGISDTMQQVNEWGNVTGNAMGFAERAFISFGIAAGGSLGEATQRFQDFRDIGVSPVRAALVALGMTFSGFGAVIFPAINAFDSFTSGNYAEGFRRIGASIRTIASNIADAAIAAGSWVLNVGAPAVGGWLLDLASDAWGALKSAAGWAGNLLADIGSWTLDTAIPAVTGWIVTAASNVWDALKSAAGWAWDQLVDLGSWTLDTAIPTVTGWITTAASNVWDALKTAAGWAWDGLTDLGSWTLDTAIPAVTGWIVTAAGNVWEALKTAAGWAWDGIADIGTITLQVGGWLVEAAEDAWEAVKRFATGGRVNRPGSVASGATSGGMVIDWPQIKIAVKDFLIELDLPGLNAAIEAEFQKATIADSASLAAAEAAGREQGKSLGDRFFTALSSNLGGSGGGGSIGGDDSGSATGLGGMRARLRAFLEGAFSGLGDSFNEIISPQIQAMSDGWATSIQGLSDSMAADWQGFADEVLSTGEGGGFDQLGTRISESSTNLQQSIQTASDLIALAWSALVDSLDFPDISIDAPNIEFPKWDFTAADIPFYSDGRRILLSIARFFENPFGDGLYKMNPPTIEFPEWDFSLDDIPFYTEGKEMIQQIIDFFKDPWGGTINVSPPDIKWPSFGGDSGMATMGTGAALQGQILQSNALIAVFDRVRMSKEELDAALEKEQRLPFSDPAQIASINGVGGSIQRLRTDMSSAIPIAGQLKTAIAGIGGGGVSAEGAGALKAAGGGGGGPFASLISGMQAAKREAESFRTSMSTIGSTSLAGFNLSLGLVGLALTTFNTSLTTAGTAVTTFGTALSLAGVTYLAGFILQLGLVGIALTTFNTSLTTAGTSLTTFGTSLSLVGTTYLAGLVLGLGLVGIALSTLGTNLSTAGTAFTTFGTNIGTAMQTALVAVQTGIANITTALHSAVGPAGTAGQNVGSSFSTNLSNGLSPAPGHAQVAVAGVTSAMHAGVGPAGNAGQNMGSSFSTSLSNGLAAAEGIASSAVISVTSQLHSGVGPAGAAGRNIGNAFAAGMESALGRIRTAARSMVAAASAAVVARAMIASPSRLFVGLGVHMGEGLAVGMLNELRSVEGAADVLARAAVPSIGRSSIGGSSIPSPRRGAQFGASAQGGITVIVHQHIGGNVIAEEELQLRTIRAVSEGIVEGTRQRNRAMGVT